MKQSTMLTVLFIFVSVLITLVSSTNYFIYIVRQKSQCNGWKYDDSDSDHHTFICVEPGSKLIIKIAVSKLQPHGQLPYKTYGIDVRAALNEHTVVIQFIQQITSLVHYVHDKQPEETIDYISLVYKSYFDDRFWQHSIPEINTEKVFGAVTPITYKQLNRKFAKERTIKIFEKPAALRHGGFSEVFAMNMELYYAPFENYDICLGWDEIWEAIGKQGPCPMDITHIWSDDPHNVPMPLDQIWKEERKELFAEGQPYGTYLFINKNTEQHLYLYRSEHSELLVDHIRGSMHTHLQENSIILLEMTPETMKVSIVSRGSTGKQKDMKTSFIEAAPRQVILADIDLKSPSILLHRVKRHEFWKFPRRRRPIYDFYWMSQRNRVMVDMVNKVVIQNPNVKSFWITIGADHYGNFMYKYKDVNLNFLGMSDLLTTPTLQRPYVTKTAEGYSYLFPKAPQTIIHIAKLRDLDFDVGVVGVNTNPIVMEGGIADIRANQQYINLFEDYDDKYGYNGYNEYNEYGYDEYHNIVYHNNILVMFISLIFIGLVCCMLIMVAWYVGFGVGGYFAAKLNMKCQQSNQSNNVDIL